WGALLAGCIGVFSLASLAMGLSPIYPLLLVGMAAVAICHSIWHLPASASLSYHFPERRGMALSFHGVGGSIGDVVGPVATGALLAVLSWREILSVYAAVPFFLAFLALWSFKNIAGTNTEEVETPHLQARLAMTKELLRNKVLWGLTVVRGLRGMALVAILTVLPLYLGNDLELGTFNRGFHIGLLIAMGLLAKPVAGYVSDRWGRKQVLVPGLIWSCAVSLLLIPFGDGIALTALILLLGLFLYPDQPIVTAAALETAGRDVATTALGVVSFGGFMMAATSPIIVGVLYETLGMAAALYYVAALFALAAVIFFVLPLRTPGPAN
ncbi:MAG: MFS transporter, partial [Dehalococcoidia bacterium]